MCRIWLDNVPPSQQPAPTSCAAAVRNRPSNGRVIFGDEPKDKKDRFKPKAVRGTERDDAWERRRGEEQGDDTRDERRDDKRDDVKRDKKRKPDNDR